MAPIERELLTKVAKQYDLKHSIESSDEQIPVGAWDNSTPEGRRELLQKLDITHLLENSGPCSFVYLTDSTQEMSQFHREILRERIGKYNSRIKEKGVS